MRMAHRRNYRRMQQRSGTLVLQHNLLVLGGWKAVSRETRGSPVRTVAYSYMRCHIWGRFLMEWLIWRTWM